MSFVNSRFTWRHRDGSIIEFGELGWSSDDPEKAVWLQKMNELSSSVPCVPPIIRIWIKTERVFVGIIASTANDQPKSVV